MNWIALYWKLYRKYGHYPGYDYYNRFEPDYGGFGRLSKDGWKLNWKLNTPV